MHAWHHTPHTQVVEKLAAGGVRLVAMRCAGFDRVDMAAAQRCGIRVVRVPTYSPQSVAEHAVALMFALNRWVGGLLGCMSASNSQGE